jgi:hypothetical protein
MDLKREKRTFVLKHPQKTAKMRTEGGGRVENPQSSPNGINERSLCGNLVFGVV